MVGGCCAHRRVCSRVGVRYSSRRRVLAWSVLGPRWWRARVVARVGGPRTQVRGPPPGGVLWRFPTLPHPLGCSTIGAAGLSFQVRNVAGRFPGAVTTTRLCRPPPLLLARRVVGWVGGGLVVVRIVVAAPPYPPPPLFSLLGSLARVCGPGGGCLVARPSLLAPFFVSGAPGPPLCGGVRRLGGWVPGLGGVGVVSAH